MKREKLSERISGQLYEMIVEEKRSLNNYVGLGPNDLDKVSERIFPTFKNIFASYGLTITNFTIGGSTVNNI